MLTKEANFWVKAAYLQRAARAGVFTPIPDSSREFIDRIYISDRGYPNPSFKILKNEFFQVIREAEISKHSKSVYRFVGEDTRFSKGIYLAFWVSFADQHQIGLPLGDEICHKARQFVFNIIEKSDRLGRQITITEQFKEGMNQVSNNLLDALACIYIGTRAVGRGLDTCINKNQFNFSQYQMDKWRDCVSFFNKPNGSYGDPLGDTYHFWGNVLAGFTNELILTPKDKVLNPVYKNLYQSSALATKYLRYTLTEPKATSLHQVADQLGYKMGQKMSRFIQYRNKLQR